VGAVIDLQTVLFSSLNPPAGEMSPGLELMIR
jgi:hypothetical protein